MTKLTEQPPLKVGAIEFVSGEDMDGWARLAIRYRGAVVEEIHDDAKAIALRDWLIAATGGGK